MCVLTPGKTPEIMEIYMPVTLIIPRRLQRRLPVHVDLEPDRRSAPGDLPGPPMPVDFETEADASSWAADLIKVLHRTGQPETVKLAERLSQCDEHDPCGSAACAKCTRAFRMRLHREVLRVTPTDAEYLAVSLIPRSSRVEVGELSLNLATWVKSRQRGFARALPPEARLVGGVDISFNTYENGDPHWRLHLYAFIILPLGWGVDQPYRCGLLRSAIERHCPPIPMSERIGREVPLKVGARSRRVFEDKLLYAHKAGFYCRSRYSYVKRKSEKRSTNVDHQSLRPAHSAELALFLEGFGLGARLILVGLRRRGRGAAFSLCEEGGQPVATK